MAQNIIYSLWEESKGPWLCLMPTLLLFGLLWCFPLFLHSSFLWLNLFFDQSFPQTGGRQRKGGEGRTIGTCSVSISTISDSPSISFDLPPSSFTIIFLSIKTSSTVTSSTDLNHWLFWANNALNSALCITSQGLMVVASLSPKGQVTCCMCHHFGLFHF